MKHKWVRQLTYIYGLLAMKKVTLVFTEVLSTAENQKITFEKLTATCFWQNQCPDDSG